MTVFRQLLGSLENYGQALSGEEKLWLILSLAVLLSVWIFRLL